MAADVNNDEIKIKGKIKTTTEVEKKTTETKTADTTGATGQPTTTGAPSTGGQPSTGVSGPEPENQSNRSNTTNMPDGTYKPEPELEQKPLEQPPKPGESPNDQRIKEAVDKNKPVDLSGKNKAEDKLKQGAENKLGKEGVGKVAGKGLKQKAAQAAQAAAKWLKSALSKALMYIVDAFGWPVLIVVAAICLIIILIFLLVACAAYGGEFGKTYPQKAGKDNKSVISLINANKTAATGITGDKYHRLDFLNADDIKFIEDGLIDKRLAAALDYLQNLHKRIAVSHIISAYKDMPNDPEADPQLSQNVSAHKDGLAADVSEIDFVYKAFVSNVACPKGIGDIVYYSDGSKPAGEPNIIEDSNGAILSNDSLNTTLSDFNDKINSNIDNLNQTIDDANASIESNRDKILANLPDDKKLEVENIKINTDAAKKANDELKNTINATTNQLKDYNQKLADLQATVNQATPSAEINDISAKLQTAQLNVLKATQKIDQLNNSIENLNDKLATATSDLNQLIVENQAAITEGLKNITDSLNLDQGLKDLSQMLNLPVFNTNINMAKIATDKANEVIRAQLGDQYGQVFGDFGNVIGGLGSVFGSSGNELLHLYCQAIMGTNLGSTNTTYEGNPAEAIPIHVSWQDRKPNVIHVDNKSDEAIGVDPRVYSMVYQPEARKKVHQVISELLQMPYDLAPKDISEYRVTQLITFSESRDVAPFKDILDKLYGQDRPVNFGLFSMPESWGQVHIGY